MGSLLIRNLKGLVQHADGPQELRKGKQMLNLPVLENAWLLIEDGKFKSFGKEDGSAPEHAEEIVDGSGRYAFPGWCDPHTHIVFAGSRETEFVDKIKGLSYEEIFQRGGGILNSARRLAETDEEALFEQAMQRLHSMMLHGTAAVEIKSGYGLSVESELKMLRVIKRIKEHVQIPIKATYLGAHALPQEYKNNRPEYIQLVCNLIPQLVAEGLADYVDVFCDKGFFTPDETAQILETGAKYGLKAKIHANELDFSGGIQVGVAYDAVSVDHLEFTGQAEIDSLLKSDTIPTLLPGTAFFLRIAYPPARKMIDAGLGVALATDFNPGSSPSGNYPFVLSLAALYLKMLPEEIFNAATLNAAHAMEVAETNGVIRVGAPANFFLTEKIPSLAFIPYAYGQSPVWKVWIQGKAL